MFVINLNYIAPLEKIDAIMGDHMKFLQKYYKLNAFVASGRKVPRTGGIILALAKSKEEVEKIINEDPFVKNRLAEYSITEFKTSQVHPDVKSFLG
ncbi:MAG TPA: YciI family protein [Cyclobacteriaceae bacterium]|nr:YciI family protein [Cyclobacteriaceae bacterium]